MYVPCGKCMTCRVSRTKEWAVRMVHERSSHRNSIFVTLTYNDLHYPLDGNVSKRELQNFIKRLRKKLKCTIKYYACGEYGEENGRPHYHLIIFGIGFKAKENIESAWTDEKGEIGRVWLGKVEYKSCRYTAKYIQKQLSGEMIGEQTQPFALMSQGLGKDWCLKNKDQILDNMYITMDGIKMSIPRYYCKLLNIDTEQLREANQERRERMLQNIRKNYKNLPEMHIAILDSRQQSELNLKARTALKKDKL